MEELKYFIFFKVWLHFLLECKHSDFLSVTKASQTHSAYSLHRIAGAAHLSGAKLLENPHITEYKLYSVKSNMFHSVKEWLNNLFMTCDMHKVKMGLSAGSFWPQIVLIGIL